MDHKFSGSFHESTIGLDLFNFEASLIISLSVQYLWHCNRHCPAGGNQSSGWTVAMFGSSWSERVFEANGFYQVASTKVPGTRMSKRQSFRII